MIFGLPVEVTGLHSALATALAAALTLALREVVLRARPAELRMSPGRSLLLAAALALACSGGEPRGPCDAAPPPGALGSVCGFENPEDVAWVPAARLLLVSQMRHPGDAGGRLARRAHARSRRRADRGAAQAVAAGGRRGRRRARRRCRPPAIPPARIRPTPRASRRTGSPSGAPGPDGEIPVAVVGHGVREAVELFALRGAGEAATLRWQGCVRLPENATGNDVWLGEDGALWVTNYQPAVGGLRGLFYTIVGGLGLPTGEVLRWRASRWESIPGTRGANPNGLLLLPGGETLAVAFTGAGSVGLRPLAPGAGSPRDDRNRRPPRQSDAQLARDAAGGSCTPAAWLPCAAASVPGPARPLGS